MMSSVRQTLPVKANKPGQACAHCHARKIKCHITPFTGEPLGPCPNCQKLGIECRPHIRKRKRDNDVPQQLPSPTAHGRLDDNSLNMATSASPLESSYLGRSDYLDAHVPIDEAHASQYQKSPDPRTTSANPETTLQILDTESLVPRSMRQSLLSSFLKRCWPWMPLLSPDAIRAMFESNAQPNFLMLSILAAGSKVSQAPRAAELGALCYQRAKSVFYSGVENNTVHVIVGTVFLQWWNQTGPEHISVDNSSFWLRMGVALAHQIGLHRQPDFRHPQYQLRRKLWWALVSRDNQIATSHGRPRAINLQDSSVRPLDKRDFNSFDEDALLFVNFVQITQILGDLTQHCLRGDLTQQRRIETEKTLLSWLHSLPKVFHLCHRETHALNPYTVRSRQLHVPYFVILIILFRQGAPDRCPSAISVLAASFISGIFEEYLDWGDIAFVSPPSIFYLLVASLLQVSSHRFAPLSFAAEKETRITDQAIEHLKKRFHTAFGAERVIQSTRRLANPETVSNQAIQLRVEAGQEDFFSVFGPDLCSHWNVVLNPTPLTRSADSPAVSMPPVSSTHADIRSQNNLLGADATWGNTFQDPQLPMQDFSYLPDQTDWTLHVPYASSSQLDQSSQWWWTDLVP
ncbi:fungal-specific transcription factor domain-containing protein [Exophiala viscosa]|uniref:Fungal-specific transcription factor domain-containing protein n=2 Tax=Exophiala viscosa TaxID=2486360 RepID=A0AAN6DYE0_9EURO|nr:fungal-specific transcription factor domain-containing protein [Exophiala viscosa]